MSDAVQNDTFRPASPELSSAPIDALSQQLHDVPGVLEEVVVYRELIPAMARLEAEVAKAAV